ncbi:MAG: DUF5063 domain-containing protein [Bacteroidaceae bacterium]|nr:DUF5063 domain-containing protein [Bacteroidaceae bacterium]
MKAKKTVNVIYGREALEFVAVAAQYCAFLEGCEGCDKDDFIAAQLKLLPQIYARALQLPIVECSGDFLCEEHVKEEDYEWICRIVSAIMQDDDEYEDISMTDLGPEERVWHSVSEGLADVYQPLRNFVSVYQQRIEDCMHDALWEVMDNFELYWGQALLDTLRRLHQLRYTIRDDADEAAL